MTGSEEEASYLRDKVHDLAYHQLRILLLVDAVSRQPKNAGKLDGLTKLAKLDFLVRYPVFATRVLSDEHELGDASFDQRLHLVEADRGSATSVADPMIRYKYGPWDDRYYAIVGALVARDLVRYVRGRRGSVALTPTGAGRTLLSTLMQNDGWHTTADRCEFVAELSAGLSGSALKSRIYERLPELMDRPHREVIS